MCKRKTTEQVKKELLNMCKNQVPKLEPIRIPMNQEQVTNIFQTCKAIFFVKIIIINNLSNLCTAILHSGPRRGKL